VGSSVSPSSPFGRAEAGGFLRRRNRRRTTCVTAAPSHRYPGHGDTFNLARSTT
jgi:hypothetical protein